MSGSISLAGGALAALLLSVPLAAAEQRVQLNDTELLVEIDRRLPVRQDGAPWLQWLHSSLQAAHGLTGGYPPERVQIRLHATQSSGPPVSFGQVRRSTPPQIHFYVNPDADLAELQDDWRGYHEFAHLLIPFPGNDDIWFSEGFASYYQYVLQSRVGHIDPDDAWRKLAAGFQRGVDDPRGRGRSLRKLSPNMWQERAYRRVYWTGAAFFLRVDTRLRQASNGEHSIDTALAAFHACCMNSRRRWDAASLVQALGELSLPAIWQDEYRATVRAIARPEYAPAFAALGIERAGSTLRFSSDPEAVALREAIAGPRSTLSSAAVGDAAETASALP